MAADRIWKDGDQPFRSFCFSRPVSSEKPLAQFDSRESVFPRQDAFLGIVVWLQFPEKSPCREWPCFLAGLWFRP